MVREVGYAREIADLGYEFSSASPRAEVERLCMQNFAAAKVARVFFKDRETRFVLVSGGFAQALGGGLTPDELIGKTDFDLFSTPHATAALEDELQVMRTGEPIVDKIERETFNDRPDLWVSTTKLPLRDEAGQIIGTWGISRDVTAQREAEEALVHQSLHDALTGLPNRVLVIDRTEQMLARARRHGNPVAALYIDLDGFKQVNDRFGHAAGDELLQAVAARLTMSLREADTAGRLGGDEFVVLSEGFSDDTLPASLAERLCEVLAQPIELASVEGRSVSVTASVGIAVGQQGSAEGLLRDADFAMYEAKRSGKNRWADYDAGMLDAAQTRLELEMDLRDAVVRDELFLLYQPTVDLRTNAVVGVEALVRWRHPTRGLITPDVLIPIAEASDLIRDIGAWVLKTACEQAARWHATDSSLELSVNVSARQLESDDFIDLVRKALEASGLAPACLTLEVTETTLMRDIEAAAARLRNIKALGVRISIDDFGTGYSSLAYLRQLPVDGLKIDRSFISGVAGSPDSAALIRTLVQLGKTLNLQTLGEGIEDDAQLETLRHAQCDLGQGFLFARPLEVDAITEMLTHTEE